MITQNIYMNIKYIKTELKCSLESHERGISEKNLSCYVLGEGNRIFYK